MTIYRVIKTLDFGKRQVKGGDLIFSRSLAPDSIKRLEAVGAIGELNAPPLAALPGLEREAEQLQIIGITESDQFLEADIEQIANSLGVKRESVQRWRDTVYTWLTIPDDNGSG